MFESETYLLVSAFILASGLALLATSRRWLGVWLIASAFTWSKLFFARGVCVGR